MIIITAIIFFTPFYSMIISSTHSNSEIERKLLLTPGTRLMDNYQRLIDVVPIWRGFFNSVFIAVISTILGLYFSALGGYGFSKYQFRGNGILLDRKSTRLNSSHVAISYAVFCLNNK